MSTSHADCAVPPPLFGVETEYAYTAGTGEHAGERFLEAARSRLAHLPGPNNDLFLTNGSRLYIDCGSHPELATPECANPWQAVRYCLAGDRIVGDVASNLRDVEGWVSKCNVDYSGASTTWASHSSFLYRCAFPDLAQQLVPHLASRIVYSGAGGWHPFKPGLEFVLSPRAFHLNKVISGERANELGLVNVRDESLSRDGNSRLHLQCGDSVESQTAIFLAVGTTALIVALTHAGIEMAAAVALTDPLGAMQTFALDPTCRATAPTARGDRLSAVAIQRHYLRIATEHAGEPFMPRWTPHVCRLWRTILDRLDAGAPWTVSNTLDWAIKYVLYNRMLRQAGKEACLNARESGTFPAESRNRFLEADLRFAQVTGSGLFHELDQARVLRHRVAGVGRIDRAMSVPPAGSRAAVRGRLIRDLHGQAGQGSAYWDGIVDRLHNRRCDLSDPFCQKAVWGPVNDPSIAARAARARDSANALDQVASLYRRGHYAEAARLLAGVPDAGARYWRYRGWLQARMGQLGGIELLDRATPWGEDIQYLYDHLTVARFQGLAAPIAPMQEWIDRIEALMRDPNWQPGGLESAFWDHKGAFLLRCNRLEEAVAAFEKCHSSDGAVDYIRGRSAALLAETYRRLNKTGEARGALALAGRVHRVNRIAGDRADFSMGTRAKLEADPAGARRWLKRAETIQRQLQNHVGLTRNLLLQVRFTRSAARQANLKQQVIDLVEGLPAVRDCEVYQRILRDWDQWAGDKQATDEHGDRFWGL